MNLVTSSAVPRLTTFASGTIRFTRPASTAPGPTSTNRIVRAKADHVRLRDDSLQETGEHGAGADFDEPRAVASEPRRVLHAFYPTNGRRELVGQEAPRPTRVLDRLSGGVGDHREHRICELGALERELEEIARGAHQRRVKRTAHLQRNDALRAALFAELAGPRDRLRVRGENRLVGGVHMGRHGDARLLRPLGARRFDVFRRESEYRRHGTGTLFPGLLHQLTPPADQFGCRRRLERARRHVGRVLAERMTGGGDGLAGFLADDREDRGAVREDRGLRVLGGGQLVFRAVEHEARERCADRGVDGVEHGARRRKAVCQILPHADFLRALTGAQPDRAYQRTTMLPPVKPAPIAQSITVMPGLSRRVFTASSSAIAIDAADVLPKRSTFT